MSSLSRQNTLFVSEDWVRIYEALENVDFRAYDFDNLVQSLMTYVRNNYPSEYNDWVASAEFTTKIEILAWLSQNIAFRIDLNARENFLATAERRESLIRLAQNVAYKVNRVRSASGQVKIDTIRTTQDIKDLNGTSLRNQIIRWNDPRNEDWFEQFITIMNAALSVRTQFGRPLGKHQGESFRTDQYIFDSVAPESGSYSFSTSVDGVSVPFDIHNARLDTQDGSIDEIAPTQDSTFGINYLLDGVGFGSNRTGFFLPIKQGQISFQDENLVTPQELRVVTLGAENINNDDLFVQEIDQNGNVLENWTKVDTIFGEGVSFNTLSSDVQSIFELDTLSRDKVRVRFGDGSFGRIPSGSFRFWYRTANSTPLVINPRDVQNQSITIPYLGRDQSMYFLTLTFSLKESLTNAAATESNFDIRTRANQVFYTQNRMVTADDYNQFFLKDNAVQKVKTVNRTFSGHSRFSRLNDPTGLYQSVSSIGSDGRFYQDTTLAFEDVTADPAVLSHQNLISTKILPLLSGSDIAQLYLNQYNELFLQEDYTWDETDVLNGLSRGNITLNGAPQVVGDNATGNLSFVKTGSVIRHTDLKGETVSVRLVTEDGDAASGITLSGLLSDGTDLISVLPPIRTTLTQSEVNSIEARLQSELDFALSWSLENQAWQIVLFDNIDKTSSFSLLNQGDTTSQKLDASWLIMVEFVSDSQNGDTWRITNRGLGLFIESARELEFIFTNTGPVLDPELGAVVQDEISLLESNESRDSLRRRGIALNLDVSNQTIGYNFTGDGTTTCFQTREIPLVSEDTLVYLNGTLQALNVSYTFREAIDGWSVCFNTAPADGVSITVLIAEQLVNVSPGVTHFVTDGIENEFGLGQDGVNGQNTILFQDGVLQIPSQDYGIGSLGSNTSILYSGSPDTDQRVSVHFVPSTEVPVFTRSVLVGDGLETSFEIGIASQTEDSLLVALDGLVQDPDLYSITSDQNSTTVVFSTAPDSAVQINLIGINNPDLSASGIFRFDTDGSQNSFALSGFGNLQPEQVMVFLDGVAQEGPGGTNPAWVLTGGNEVFFQPSPPHADAVVVVWVIANVVSVDQTPVTPTGNEALERNLGALNVSSQIVNFLGEDVGLTPDGVIRHDDGYVNTNGLKVVPKDSDLDGIFDNPYVFRDVVLQDGITDLVLWRRVEEFGTTIWDPISELTVPKGTYGLSAQNEPAVGDTLASGVENGDIHYDITTDTWLVAQTESNTWIEATNQTQYRFRIGRDNLRFLWKHYSPESNRIDPSRSNIMNVYVLTTGYDEAYRVWLDQNGSPDDEPQPETPESLRITFQEFEDFKPLSDGLIYYSARYRPLFGSQADQELRARFKIIQTAGSNISESDLKLRVLDAINAYFDVDRWDFGDTFYFTELCAFIHATIAPDLQTVVIVPTQNSQSFGRLFQVRSEPDQLFVSAASPEDIDIVTSLTDEEIRLGCFA